MKHKTKGDKILDEIGMTADQFRKDWALIILAWILVGFFMWLAIAPLCTT